MNGKGYIQKRWMGITSALHTGEYDDGKIGENFIDTNKEGELVKAMMIILQTISWSFTIWSALR